ncbi:MAG: Crp/Fnr family transcriptional regulator [Salibacteraceae bacterium]
MEELTKRVKEITDGVYPLSVQAFSELSNIWVSESYLKGDLIIQKNRPNNKEYFLLDGVCKSYVVNTEGEEVIISFFTENQIFSPHSIRISKGFSNQYFQASTDVELVSMDAKLFENLMIENEEIRNFGNTVMQNELIGKVEKEIGLASFSAKDRLIAFRERYTSLENRIPHTEIASYLGITNISLSRLRRELIG